MPSEINQKILDMARDGVKYSVIAEQLGLTASVVKGRLHQMRMTKESRDKLNARRRKYKRDPEKAKEYIRNYIKNHPEKPAEWSKAYRERHRDAKAKWRAANPEKLAEQRQRYNEKRRAAREAARNNPEAIAERDRKALEKAERSKELARLRTERYNAKRKENNQTYVRLKERLAADPEFKAQYLEKRRKINAERRRKKIESIPEAERERNRQRAREARIKAVKEANARRRAERLADAPAKQPKEKVGDTRHLPKVKGKLLDKRKPGRLLALMGWRGF